MEEISFSEFINLRNYIYESTGIFFEEKKIYFIKKRVEKRLIELNLDSVSTYLRLLKTSRESSKELQTLTNLLTMVDLKEMKQKMLGVNSLITNSLFNLLKILLKKLIGTVYLWVFSEMVE